MTARPLASQPLAPARSWNWSTVAGAVAVILIYYLQLVAEAWPVLFGWASSPEIAALSTAVVMQLTSYFVRDYAPPGTEGNPTE